MRIVLGVVFGLLALGYPFAVYYGLSHWSARGAGLLVLAVIAVMAFANASKARHRELWPVLRAPLAIALIVAAGAAVDSPHGMLAIPVLINLSLLFEFGRSLRTDLPIVERFARLQDDDLTPQEAAYCRQVTVVWCGYFAVNAAIAATLALLGPLSWWTLYTGIVGYIGMATVFTSEYIVRKYRFRRFGNGLVDRLLARILPGAANDPARQR